MWSTCVLHFLLVAVVVGLESPNFITSNKTAMITIDVMENDFIVLECPGNTEEHNYWYYMENRIAINRIPVRNYFKSQYGVLENVSLWINHASLSNEGSYTCTLGSNAVVSYFVEIKVPPKLYLIYDSEILSNASYHKDDGYERNKRKNMTYVAEKDIVNVTCLAEGAKPEAIITWKKNGVTVNNVSQVTQPNSHENRTFDSRSFLLFSATEENITVSCNIELNGTDIEASTSATFLTYVEPSLSFLLNGSRIHSDVVYVKKGETISITCLAEGSRPSSNLTLEDSYDHLESLSNIMENGMFDSKLTLVISPERDLKKIVCQSTLVEVDITQTMGLEIKTYVIQGPSIVFKGTAVTNVLKIEPNVEVNLTCHAFDSEPKPKLTWKINKLKLAQDTRIVHSSSSVSLNFLPRDNDLVECVIFLDGPNITRTAIVTFDLRASFNFIIISAVSCGAVIFILLFIICVYIAARRFRGSSDLSADEGIPMKEKETSGAAKPKTRHKDYEEEACKVFTKPPDLELPNIPKDSETPYYSDLPEQTNAYEVNIHTEEYYSVMGESDANGKMFREKDICFVINMKKGHIYNRWMGTIDINPEEKKCVVFSTVSDNVRKKDIHWDKFVKQALQLPVATHLTKVEGIGINEGKMYLIHEDMTCETLDVRISDPITRTEMMGYLIGILEGLEVIQSFGLLHPGLSTRKVLLTKQGICKLYDFCLSEDASNIVKIRKSRIICTLNQLSPEALLRDKYTKESDVWSVAVVIWEILSCGSPPFANEEQSPHSEKAVYSVPDTWPTNYKLLRNNVLFDCWNQDTSLRPSTFQLKSYFVESFESLDTYGSSNTSTDGLAASYIHMKGTGKSTDDS